MPIQPTTLNHRLTTPNPAVRRARRRGADRRLRPARDGRDRARDGRRRGLRSRRPGRDRRRAARGPRGVARAAGRDAGGRRLRAGGTRSTSAGTARSRRCWASIGATCCPPDRPAGPRRTAWRPPRPGACAGRPARGRDRRSRPGSPCADHLPFSSRIARLQNSATNVRSWVTSTIALARSTSSRTRAWLRARNVWSPVPRTSSSSRMSGVDRGRDREPESGAHPGRVRLHRRVDERADVGELDDRRRELVHLVRRRSRGTPRPGRCCRARSAPSRTRPRGSAASTPGRGSRSRLRSARGSPARASRSVLLPAPFGPMTASDSPWARLNERWRIAQKRSPRNGSGGASRPASP